MVDPACGTGTLLMAAYRQIVQNHSAAAPAGSGNPLLHQVLVEQVINGADVVQSAIHLTAATLAAMSPLVRFKQMQLHTLRLGTEIQKDLQGNKSRRVWLGSLDWLEASEIQSFFSATEEQIGALLRFAKHKRAMVKIGPFQGLGKRTAPYLDLLPLIERVVGAYGPERCMWESDSGGPIWMSDPDTEYPAAIALIRDHASFLTQSDKDYLLFKTAENLFFKR